MKLLENSPKISEIESALAKYTFLSRNSLPGYLDGSIFLSLLQSQTYPDRRTNPHFYHWYILIRQFSATTIRSWIEHRLYYNPDDAHIQNLFLTTPNSPTKSANSSESGSPRGEESAPRQMASSEMIEAQYIIDILLKEPSEQVMDQLRRCLQGFRVDVQASLHSREVRVRCGCESSRRQQVVNLISRSIQYSNLQVKKWRPKRDSCGKQTSR